MTFLYFIKNKRFVKVGVSDHPNDRLKELQTGNPRKLHLLRTIPFESRNEAFELEKFIHQKYNHLRIEGEWFKGGEFLRSFKQDLINLCEKSSEYSKLRGFFKPHMMKTFKKKFNEIVIYTDGSYWNNECGVGVVFYLKNKWFWISEYHSLGTSQRAELLACILALNWIKIHEFKFDFITIRSDSQYLVNTINDGWQRNTNHDLWQQLDELIGPNCRFEWIRGHSGIVGNRLADHIAGIARKNKHSSLNLKSCDEFSAILEKKSKG